MISARFVGRTAELAQLAGHLDAAGSGRGGVVLVRGAAGVGKTRLVEEALSGRDVVVGRGYAVQDGGAPTMWCWMQACAAARPHEKVETFQRTPERSDAGDESTAARFRWIAELAENLAAVDEPHVLVLEDVHWADRATVDLLRAVASSVSDSPLLVIATTRPTDSEREAQYGLIERFPTVTTLHVPPLSLSAVADLLGTTSDEAADARAQTHGLPLLLTAGIDTDSGRYDIRRIALSLAAQAGDRLAPDLEAAAVLGEQIDRPLLAAVLGRVPDVEGLSHAGLLTADHDRFLHALIRDAIADTVPPDRARHIHQSAAEHLMTVPGTPASRIASRLSKAGDPRVREWAELAAAAALSDQAYDEAVAFLELVETAQVSAGTEPEELARTSLRIAEAAYLGGHPADSLARCRKVSAATDHPELLASAALVVREVAFPEADQTNIELARRALATVQPAAMRSRLLAQLSTAYSNSSRLTDAATAAADAWQDAVSSDDPRALLAAAQAREATMYAPGDDYERLTLARAAADQARRIDRPVVWSLALGWQMRAAYALADVAAAAESLDDLTSLTARTGLPLLQLRLARTVAAVASLEGRFDEARAGNDEAHRLALAAGDPIAGLLCSALDIHLAFLRGQFGELQWDEMVEAPPDAIPIALGKRALFRLAEGDERGARADYLRLRPLLWGPGVDLMAGAVFADVVRLVEHFADAEAALAAAAKLEPWLGLPGVVGIPMAYFCAPAAAYVGRCMLVADKPSEAVPHLRHAISVAEKIHSRPYAASARCDLADALIRTGADREARRVLDEVSAEAHELEMPGLLQRATRLRPPIESPLSPREQEIAALVLDALSNRAIADHLVISERTVETHVRSVLNKLNCATRTELIARHHEFDLLSATARGSRAGMDRSSAAPGAAASE